jgi:CRISPR-associated protein (TIGR02584 family)
MKTILLSASGMSPAIITETLWALACEVPPVVPDEVIVITTTRGEADLQRLLLSAENGWQGMEVWQHLRADIFREAGRAASDSALQLSIKVIDLPAASGIRVEAADIRTPEENSHAADFILRTLRTHADNEDCQVIASIAGGRKTMGALLYGAMCLVGKDTDRITHVLVNEPYELCKGFFYPAQFQNDLQAGFGGNLTAVQARDARIELADIPFVPLRYGFKELREPTLSFHGLVHRYSSYFKAADVQKPRVSLNVVASTISVDDTSFSLAGRELLAIAFLFLRAKEGKPKFNGTKESRDSFLQFIQEFKKSCPNHKATITLPKEIAANYLTQGLSSFKKKLEDKGMKNKTRFFVPDRGRLGFEIDFS